MVFDVETSQVLSMRTVQKSDAEWKQQLTPQQYHVTREQGTEPAFSGKYLRNTQRGVYRCICCGAALYSSEAKYDSGTGWPSFWKPIAKQNLRYEFDARLFARRTEVLCAACGAHLGHVFHDGPPPTNTRHCINSVALQFLTQDA